MALSKETLYKALYNYAKEEIEDLDTWLKRVDNESITASNVISYMNDLTLINVLVSLRQDIREQANKKAGKANIEKAMQAVIKTAGKLSRPQLNGFFMSDGRPAVCDGHRAIRAAEMLDIGEPVEGMNISEILQSARANSTKELPLPSFGELKAFIALKKAEQQGQRNKKILYDFGENLPLVDAIYLLDMLTAFPDADAFCGHNSSLEAIYFDHPAGEGLLLPVRA